MEQNEDLSIANDLNACRSFPSVGEPGFTNNIKDEEDCHSNDKATDSGNCDAAYLRSTEQGSGDRATTTNANKVETHHVESYTYSSSEIDTSNSTNSASGSGTSASGSSSSGAIPALGVLGVSSDSYTSSKPSDLASSNESSSSPSSAPISSLSGNPPAEGTASNAPHISSLSGNSHSESTAPNVQHISCLSENPPTDSTSHSSGSPDRSTNSRSPDNNSGSPDSGLSELGPYDPYLDFKHQLTLKKFQEEVSTRCHRGENDIVILPTGTGKTYVAIQVIKDHLKLNRPPKRCKIVFLVPTETLASQQLQKIKDYVSEADSEKCRKVTGEDKLPLGQVRDLITKDEYTVLVVTPAILNNYFEASKRATISDFTLLIFDECHHAKEGHPYNVLLEKYHRVKWDDQGLQTTIRSSLPQLIGMSASIGVGTSKSLALANDFMLSMFARFDLEQPPVKVTENIEELKQYSNRPDEKTVFVESHREDVFTNYLEVNLMGTLEGWITGKTRDMYNLTQGKLDLRKLEFPADRHSQVYEQFLIEQKDKFMTYLTVEQIKEQCNYVLIALEHLLTYYKTLELVNLLDCAQSLKYICAMDGRLNLQSVEEIWSLREGNIDVLQDLGEEVDKEIRNNEKLTKLRQRLHDQFQSEPESKIIIFVRMRVVAKYLAEWLCNAQPKTFRAKEFTSSGPSMQEGGMKPSQLLDAREGFENDKYNILVSTSVLEEGIDIQACNMVVRYMYSKDMIGKIQARGRVRHKDGKIVTILDSKLLQQEKKNEFKETLMNQALEIIQQMTPDDFKKSLETKRLNMFPRKFASQTPEVRKTAAPILCAKCGAHLGNLEDIRCFMKAHHLVLDRSLHERVEPFPDRRGMQYFDGLVPLGLLNCKSNAHGTTCNNRVGVIIRMADTGASFGMWNIKAILIGGKNYKKYQQVKDRYIIPDIYLEDLTEELVEECQFNVEMLSRMKHAVGM